jgi:DNA polymerase/3'-5' exonuclease PolX
MENVSIARQFREHARQLQAQQENLYRVRAYRWAADVIERLPRPLQDIYKETGKQGLERLPQVGRHLAYTLESLLTTGEFRTWEDRPRRCA